MNNRDRKVLRVCLMGILLAGCQLEEPMEFGERCDGVQAVYLGTKDGNIEWCEGDSCEYSK